MLLRLIHALTVLVLLTASGCVNLKHGPVGFWSRNRYDRSGELRQGPWRGYFDMRETRLANAGRYRHGVTVGRWRYYSPTGQLERTERYHWWPAGQVTLTYYHPNGQPAKRGLALYRSDATTLRFFWFGEWKCYTPDGRALPPEYYRNGIQVATPQAPVKQEERSR